MRKVKLSAKIPNFTVPPPPQDFLMLPARPRIFERKEVWGEDVFQGGVSLQDLLNSAETEAPKRPSQTCEVEVFPPHPIDRPYEWARLKNCEALALVRYSFKPPVDVSSPSRHPSLFLPVKEGDVVKKFAGKFGWIIGKKVFDAASGLWAFNEGYSGAPTASDDFIEVGIVPVASIALAPSVGWQSTEDEIFDQFIGLSEVGGKAKDPPSLSRWKRMLKDHCFAAGHEVTKIRQFLEKSSSKLQKTKLGNNMEAILRLIEAQTAHEKTDPPPSKLFDYAAYLEEEKSDWEDSRPRNVAASARRRFCGTVLNQDASEFTEEQLKRLSGKTGLSVKDCLDLIQKFRSLESESLERKGGKITDVDRRMEGNIHKIIAEFLKEHDSKAYRFYTPFMAREASKARFDHSLEMFLSDPNMQRIWLALFDQILFSENSDASREEVESDFSESSLSLPEQDLAGWEDSDSD